MPRTPQATFYGHPSQNMTTVGITGSAGKTTTAWLVRAILEAVGQDCGMVGSTGYELGTTKFNANVRLASSVISSSTSAPPSLPSLPASRLPPPALQRACLCAAGVRQAIEPTCVESLQGAVWERSQDPADADETWSAQYLVPYGDRYTVSAPSYLPSFPARPVASRALASCRSPLAPSATRLERR